MELEGTRPRGVASVMCFKRIRPGWKKGLGAAGVVEAGLRRTRDAMGLLVRSLAAQGVGCSLRQNGREWGALLVQRRERQAVLSQVGKAERREFGGAVVLAVGVVRSAVVAAVKWRVVAACVSDDGCGQVVGVISGQRLGAGAGERMRAGETG